MRNPLPTLSYRSFDEQVDAVASRSLMGHELPHVVQQASSSSVGRQRLLHRLQNLDPPLWFALTSGRELTERQAEKLARHLASSL